VPSKNPIAAVGSVRNFMNLIKEVNFDDIRDRAEQAPRVLVVARTDEQARQVADDVFGIEGDRFVEVRSGDRASSIDVSRYDAIVVSDPDGTNLLEDVRKAGGGKRSENVFYLSRADVSAVDRLRNEMMVADPEDAPAFGRWFPKFRPAAVHAVIDETAKANAKFAFVSSAPSVIPILGGFVSASTDMIVLTKNQVMMAYKLAAVSGRDLSDQTGILRELAPVVGAGFVWRSVAREAVSFLPFMAGVLPKVGIAFAGTYSTGKAVDYYYRYGKKPSREQLSDFTSQAMKLVEKLPLPGRDADATAKLPEQRAIDGSSTKTDAAT
jgi:uncharacterized protein (DUF697 family)